MSYYTPRERCIFRKGECLLRPEMAGKRTECKRGKIPIIAHVYRCFNKDYVTNPFQSLTFCKMRLSCNFYTHNIKKYLLFTKISSKTVSMLKLFTGVHHLGQSASSQLTNKGLIYNDFRIFIHLKSV